MRAVKKNGQIGETEAMARIRCGEVMFTVTEADEDPDWEA